MKNFKFLWLFSFIAATSLLSAVYLFARNSSAAFTQASLVGVWNNPQHELKFSQDGTFSIYRLNGKRFLLDGNWKQLDAQRISTQAEGQTNVVIIKSLDENGLVLQGIPGVQIQDQNHFNRVIEGWYMGMPAKPKPWWQFWSNKSEPTPLTPEVPARF